MEIGIEIGVECLQTLLFATTTLFVGLLVYFYTPYWRLRKVPGPPVLPFLGHLHLHNKYGPDMFPILAKEYGPIFRFHMGRQPVVVVSDADLFKEIGIIKFKSMPNRAMLAPIASSPIHQKGLFFSRDLRWSAMISAIIPVYQPSRLASLIPTMQSYIEDAAQHLSTATAQGEDINFSSLALKLSTDIIGRTAFSVDFGLSRSGSSTEHANFINEHKESTTDLKLDLSASTSILFGLLLPFLQTPFRLLMKHVPGTADRRMDQISQNLTKRLLKIVANREAEKDRDDAGDWDLVSTILSARDHGGIAARDLFTSEYVSSVAYEHLQAGSITTSITLSSVLYLVSNHPQVEKKLLQEIDGFGPRDLIPTADDLWNKFPYLDQVIKESMRLYPVTPVINRETAQQVEVGGYILPKGTWVWLAWGGLAKDPKHFPYPHLFRPERFDPTGDEEKQRHRYAYIPFGLGPRGCIGMKFSLQEIKLSIIHLYRNYVFRHSSQMETPLEMEFTIIVGFKHGVKLQAIKRSHV